MAMIFVGYIISTTVVCIFPELMQLSIMVGYIKGFDTEWRGGGSPNDVSPLVALIIMEIQLNYDFAMRSTLIWSEGLGALEHATCPIVWEKNPAHILGRLEHRSTLSLKNTRPSAKPSVSLATSGSG